MRKDYEETRNVLTDKLDKAYRINGELEKEIACLQMTHKVDLAAINSAMRKLLHVQDKYQKLMADSENRCRAMEAQTAPPTCSRGCEGEIEVAEAHNIAMNKLRDKITSWKVSALIFAMLSVAITFIHLLT